MGRIRVLPDQVANKIAAGEVVERPASVVKELLENSLDAGATHLRVEVESGGRRLIRVTDDGAGMLRDDALLAFERHATSKLRDVEDLLSIATLGFRGEALPSIASVSRLVMETRSEEETTGVRVEIAGGRILRCEEAALPRGTAVTVRDLFFNVPARKKFLRSEQTELAHIASLLTHYSLAHPDKTFELTSGVQTLLQATPAGTLRERVYQIFGSQTLDELVELEERVGQLRLPPPAVAPSEAIAAFRAGPEEPPARTYRLRGFFSRPQVQKSNRNSIFLFVNGRLIRDKLLLHAISAAYFNLIPPHAYPFALLFLDCDPEEVDVNVHPSKTEVRFRHGSFVHDFVRDAVRDRLIETRPAPAFTVKPSSPPQAAAALPYSEFTQRLADAVGAAPGEIPAPAGTSSACGGAAPEFVLRASPAPPRRLDFGGGAIAFGAAEPAAETPRLKVPDTHGGFPASALPAAEFSLATLADLRPLGQLHESFIIAAGRDGLWIIDQHVAHERILFEKVLRQQQAGAVETQQLLLPIVLTLTPGQQILYAQIARQLNEAGFDTEPFGNRTLAVKAAPAGLKAGDLEKAIHEILDNLDPHTRAISVEDLRRNIAASVACRAAIKINTPLEMAKMEWLLRELAATACPMSCPHGRPIALQYSTREILKAFHRL